MRFRWWPRIPRETAPRIDSALIDVEEVEDGRGLVRAAAHDGRRWLLPGSIAAAVVSLVNVVVPLALGRAVDAGLVRSSVAGLTAWLAVVALCYVVRAVAQTVRMQTNVGAGLVEHDLRVQALDRINAPEGLGGRPRLPGDLLAVLVTDVRAVSRAFIALTSIPGNAVVMIGALVSMAIINGWLALATLCAVPLLIALSVGGVGPVKQNTRRERRAEAAVAGSAADLTSGLRVIQGLSAAPRATQRFRVASRRGLTATLRTRRVKGIYTGAVNAAVGVFITGLTVLGGWLTLRGSISVGELVTVVGLAQTLGPPLRALGVDTATMLASAHASGDRFCELLASPPAWQLCPDHGARTTPGDGPVGLRIPIDGSGESSFEVQPGRHVGLVAPQQVCDALAEAVRHDPRTVLNGVEGEHLNPHQRRHLMLVAPRSPELFDDTARANIVLGQQTTMAGFDEVVRSAALDTVAQALPHGLETEVGEGGRQVSGGQRQRLALARALLHSPDGLFLVDPTTSVDAVTTATIAERLQRLRAGRTTIIATTSPALLARMDEVVLMDSSAKVLARGRHDELLARDDYREMLS